MLQIGLCTAKGGRDGCELGDEREPEPRASGQHVLGGDSRGSKARYVLVLTLPVLFLYLLTFTLQQTGLCAPNLSMPLCWAKLETQTL